MGSENVRSKDKMAVKSIDVRSYSLLPQKHGKDNSNVNDNVNHING